MNGLSEHSTSLELHEAAALKRAALGTNGVHSNGYSNGLTNGVSGANNGFAKSANGVSNGHSSTNGEARQNGAQNGVSKPSGRNSPALRPAVPAQLQFRPKVSTRKFPRDFTKIPRGTDYGQGRDGEFNRRLEDARVSFLEQDLERILLKVVETKKKIVFTTALIAGDCVIMDVLSRLGLLRTIPVIFIDTFHLFPETLDFLREVEEYYGFEAKYYHAADADTQEEFYEKNGHDFWKGDIEEYDRKCKIEPLQRALKDFDYDCWINGRRRDMGGLRSSLPVWEGSKVNPLAFWTFEDCWAYLRKYEVPYHPLHDIGFSSIGDMHSTQRVPLEKWMTYGGERSGRFQGLTNRDGSAKTECGIHTEIKKDAPSAQAQQQPAIQEAKTS